MEEHATRRAAVPVWVGTKSQLKAVTDESFKQFKDELDEWKHELDREVVRIEGRPYLTVQERADAIQECQDRYAAKVKLRFVAEDRRSGNTLSGDFTEVVEDGFEFDRLRWLTVSVPRASASRRISIVWSINQGCVVDITGPAGWAVRAQFEIQQVLDRRRTGWAWLRRWNSAPFLIAVVAVSVIANLLAQSFIPPDTSWGWVIPPLAQLLVSCPFYIWNWRILPSFEVVDLGEKSAGTRRLLLLTPIVLGAVITLTVRRLIG